MEQTALKKRRGRPAKKAVAAADIPTLAVEEVKETSPAVVETQYIARRGRLTDEELSLAETQMGYMKVIAGDILIHLKDAVRTKQLGFLEELKLFHEIAPYLGYGVDGNKTPADLGMNVYAQKYVEINQHIRTVEQRCVATNGGK